MCSRRRIFPSASKYSKSSGLPSWLRSAMWQSSRFDDLSNTRFISGLPSLFESTTSTLLPPSLQSSCSSPVSCVSGDFASPFPLVFSSPEHAAMTHAKATERMERSDLMVVLWRADDTEGQTGPQASPLWEKRRDVG